MNKKIVIFGAGVIAQLANYYFTIDSEYDVVAFTVNQEYYKENSFEGKPVIPFEHLESIYKKNDIYIFIALSYDKMNHTRADIYNTLKNGNYKFASYISSKCNYLSQFLPGENAFILEDNTIQPFVKIGNNVILWSGNHIGHHSEIEDHNFVSSHVVISGFCTIKSYCFLGVNSTIAHKITLAEGTLLGAGCTITKDTEKNSVYVPTKSVKLNIESFKISL